MKKNLIAICLAVIGLSAFAGTVPPDSTIFPGLTGKQLIDSVRARFRPSRTLPYAGTPDARDTLFGEIDKTASDSVTCVYSTFTIYMQPGQDPDDWSYSHGLNTEHTWPQSYLTSQSPDPTGDMNHLFPSDIEVNSSRGNWPFAEITDSQTETWYYNNTTSTSIPSSNIDLYAEYGSNTFEPREQQKGNTARAMYYMLTMYQLPDTTMAWWTGQRDILYTWHCNDPANAAEINRTRLIAPHQSGKVNPFIMDSTLIRRAYFPYLVTSTLVNFSPVSATKAESAGSCSLKVAITSPSGTAATTVQVVLTGGTGTAADINGYTTQTLTFPAGSSAVQSVVLTITDDALEEGTETIVFTLRNVSGGTSAKAGADSVFTLILTDNDDATAPVITSGPSVTGIGSSSATVVWTTNEISNSWVYYGLTTSYTDTVKNESDVVTSHSVGLSGLTASTTYHYKVSSTDPMNNGPTHSGDNTFTTTSSTGGSAFFYEPFDYPAGDSIAGIHNWTLHSGTTNPTRVVAPGLSYSGYKSKAIGNACSLFVTGEDVNRKFSAQTSGSVYASFLVKVDSATTTGDYFFHLSIDSLNTSFFLGRVYVKKDVSNNLAFGLAKGSEGATYSAFSYAQKTTYLLVLKYKIVPGSLNDSVSLFVISGVVPSSEPLTPTIGPKAAATIADGPAIGTAVLRQGGSTSGPILKLDEIKIDTSWNNAPLGVEITDFSTMEEPGRIVLKWSTASQTRCYQWQLERALNQPTDYKILASLPASGNETTNNDYFWIDNDVVPGVEYFYKLKALNIDGTQTVYGPVSVLAAQVLPVPERSVEVTPNPFSSLTRIRYQLEGPAKVSLAIYNIGGQMVRRFEEVGRERGVFEIAWDGKNAFGRPCPQGIYIYRINLGRKTMMGRMILVR